ncbi:PQQ-binding-like beta-propeller repeat protein [Halorubellus sp. JP-L1]|uniref:outer membrane protein assembly factor BamB family protein n=1 Tax=Halorubellus sp. JP-L1 TaxID=2715753 RepID=UPI00140E8CD3|nr:PQQ-binding-like beta-propeller repeat protein [Halorubellus sp. JP-L1]
MTSPSTSTADSDSDASGRSRRAVLATAGTAIAGALAGCSALGGGTTPSSFADGDWHSFGNAPGNQNHVAGGAPEPTDHAVLASANFPYAPPVVHDDVVYFATERTVHAVAVDGTDAWATPVAAGTDERRWVSGTPAIDPDHGRLYVPTRVVPRSDGPDPAPAYVTAFALDDGDPTWTTRVGDGRTYGVTVDVRDVYVRSATACVRLGPDGSEHWRTPMEPLEYDEYRLGDDFATQVAPAVENTGVYVPDRNALVKLEPGTGDERWRVDAKTPHAAPVLDDGGVVQTGWQGVVATDRYGDVRWRRDLRSLAAAAVDDTDVYVAGSDLHEIDGATGETNWQTRLSSGELATAAPVVTDESVVVDDDHPVAYRRNADGLLAPDRERWSYTQPHTSTYASPVIAAGKLFAVGPAGLHAFEHATDT